jgi:hypothetical protein
MGITLRKKFIPNLSKPFYRLFVKATNLADDGS